MTGEDVRQLFEATLPGVTGPLLQLPPDQRAIGQHDGHGMPMRPWPQAALVLVPAQLPLGFFMKLFARMLPMGQAGQLC
jgi:hypothetical protein